MKYNLALYKINCLSAVDSERISYIEILIKLLKGKVVTDKAQLIADK